MTTPSERPRPSSPLLRLEDWWAVWLGALLIALVTTQTVTLVPRVGRWTDQPASAFGDGRLIGLVALGVGLLALTSIAVFLLLQPNFWSSPWQAAQEMVFYRLAATRNLDEAMPDSALSTPSQKLGAVVRRPLVPGDFTLLPDARLSLEPIFFPIGLFVLARRERMRRRARESLGDGTAALVWMLVTWVGVTAYVPQDWDRYFLPLLPPLHLFVAVGLVASATWAWEHRPSATPA